MPISQNGMLNHMPWFFKFHGCTESSTSASTVCPVGPGLRHRVPPGRSGEKEKCRSSSHSESSKSILIPPHLSCGQFSAPVGGRSSHRPWGIRNCSLLLPMATKQFFFGLREQLNVESLNEGMLFASACGNGTLLFQMWIDTTRSHSECHFLPLDDCEF